MALTSTRAHADAAGNTTRAVTISQEQLQALLWFYRREDMSTWNYSILALSIAVMFLGFLLLGINVMANRNRKIILYKQSADAEKPSEPEAKPPFVHLKEDSNLNPLTQTLIPNQQRPGEVLVQWKDGNVTTLYSDKAEEDV
ncbi:organic solute transporter subunit beta isoform X2 [Pelodiscus sinensis]|nr:organic solute transporter subunit beta isoform X2 [Pelodiscus sinensis]|eukprot:XP_014432106.1 organic solute transporter subunit beta isoform X2 [Pelodiscus sinensis]